MAKKLILKKRLDFYSSLLLMIFVFAAQNAWGQKVALKTNALLWANCTPNISVELVTGKRTTFDATVYNALNDPFNLKVRGISVEHRYWLAGRPLSRSFVGLAANGTMYRILSSKTIQKGDAGGVGLVYGYVLPIGKQWNVEFVSGFGIFFFKEKKYSKFNFDSAMDYNEKGHRFLPTKLGISAAYTF